MEKSTLFSIGHGNKAIATFVNELQSFGIEYLLDVRSKPYSRFNHFYNQNVLEAELLDHNITYAFFGELLGGLPNDVTCYVDGKVDYQKVREKSFFQQGIKLLVEANNEKLPIAIMCSESKPEECHRSKLIGQELLRYNISLKHIITSDIIREQNVVMDEITKGKNLSNLFGENLDFTSKKKY